MKSVSVNFDGRTRQSVNVEPSRLHCRNSECHSEVRRKVQFRKAEPTCSDSVRLAPLKSHSVKTTRSVCSSRKSSS
ncbi:Uncharacterised protein [Mycobacteroides abscessus subsp. abscessus]|nr:Uncharacterised protein [Mycobacteroides abscessus subsp. abscessus]